MYIFYNGDIIDEATLNLGYNNRAFAYGDGLFETIIYKNCQTRFEQYHKERLTDGMKAMHLGLTEKLTIDSIFSNVHQLVKSIGYQTARVRLQVWRSTGGLYTPKNNYCNVIATCFPFEATQELVKKKVRFSNTSRLVETNWSSFKTISAMSYVQAGIEKTQRNLDELVLLDQQERVSECTSSNIFWKKGSTYYTPSLKTGCIRGVMRRHIIDQLNKHSVELQIGEYFKTQLLEAEEVFSCNVAGIYPITSIDKQQYSNTLSITPLLEL